MRWRDHGTNRLKKIGWDRELMGRRKYYNIGLNTLMSSMPHSYVYVCVCMCGRNMRVKGNRLEKRTVVSQYGLNKIKRHMA
jgi:hypothetical protein